jgi:hypothetical protein
MRDGSRPALNVTFVNTASGLPPGLYSFKSL